MTTPFRREYHIGNWFFTYFKYKHDRTVLGEKIQYVLHPKIETAPWILTQPKNKQSKMYQSTIVSNKNHWGGSLKILRS